MAHSPAGGMEDAKNKLCKWLRIDTILLNRMHFRFLAGMFLMVPLWNLVSCSKEASGPPPFVVGGSGMSDIEVIRDNKIDWSFPAGGDCDDVHMLPSGNILWAHTNGASEVTPNKQVVWDYPAPPGTEIHSVQPISNHEVLVMQSGTPATLLEIDTSSRTIEKSLVIPTTAAVHDQFRIVRKTATGTYIVPYLSENKVCEYDPQGVLLWSVPAEEPWAASRLSNGDVLISGGCKHYIREISPDGHAMWEINQNDLLGATLLCVRGAKRLANGDTLICNWAGEDLAAVGQEPQILEVTPEKKIAWSFNNTALVDLPSAVDLLDESAPTPSP